VNRREFLKLMGAAATVLALGRFADFIPNNKNDKAYAQQGSWTMGARTTTTPIHVALLHTGKILYLAGSGWDYNRQAPPYQARVLDLGTGVEKTLTQSEDLFCAGQTTLANGTILLAGGTLLYDTNPNNCNGRWHGLKAAYEFNPSTESFTKVQNMLHGRWYPTLVTLPDGKVWCYNGYDEYGVNNRLVEVYNPATKTWTRVPAPTGGLSYTVGVGQETTCPGPHPSYTAAGPTTSFYPRAHLMPSGLVVINGFRSEIRSWNPSTGSWASHGNTNIHRDYGSSFLLPLQNTTAEKGKIMVCGGSSTTTGYATTSTQILDFNTGNPTVRTVASTRFRRKYMSPVILPNGKCAVFGGTERGKDFPVLAPEMFDPITETWVVLPSSSVARHYHSTALLLTDGRVWVAGGTAVSGLWELRTEFFSPSYMTATRPTISGTPTIGAYGGSITIPTSSPTAITSVSLLRLMNTTHHYDANQRLVWLQIQSKGSSSVRVAAPINSKIAPPGYYVIHVLNSSLVPSRGRAIRIPGTATT
jgi:hypothetical protein